jgi:hypothetical protein
MGSHGFSPLVAAILVGRPEHVLLLLGYGAEIVECKSERNLQYLEERHALERAVVCSGSDVLEAPLAAAEPLDVPLEYYQDAYTSAQLHGAVSRAQQFRSELSRLFAGKLTMCYVIVDMDNKTHELQVRQDTRLSLHKDLIHRCSGRLQNSFQLVQNSRILSESLTLRELNVLPKSTMYVKPKRQWGGGSGGCRTRSFYDY